MTRLLLPSLMVLLVTLPAAAQRRVITHEDVFTMTRTADPRPSPDGRWIVFSLTEPDYDPAKTVNDLWIVPTDGGTPPRRLTSSRAAESGVDWAPDSRRIAFATKREGDDVEQIYLLPVDGGEARRLTTLPTGASNPKWRRDGRAILFESMLKANRPAPEKSTRAGVRDAADPLLERLERWLAAAPLRPDARRRCGRGLAGGYGARRLARFRCALRRLGRGPIAAGAVVARRPGDRLRRHRQPHHDDDGGDRVAPVSHPERGRRARADDEDGRELCQAPVFAGWHGAGRAELALAVGHCTLQRDTARPRGLAVRCDHRTHPRFRSQRGRLRVHHRRRGHRLRRRGRRRDAPLPHAGVRRDADAARRRSDRDVRLAGGGRHGGRGHLRIEHAAPGDRADRCQRHAGAADGVQPRTPGAAAIFPRPSTSGSPRRTASVSTA